MSKKIIQEQIMTLLEDIANQTNIINNYEGQIPQIEIDIIMSNVRKLYVTYQKLNTLNFALSPITENKSPLVEQKEEEIEVVPVVEKQKIEQEATKEVVEKQEDVAPDEDDNQTQEQVKLGLFDEEKSIGDKFQEKNHETSINESINTKKEDVSIGSKMQHKAITDIKKAIGLNEKFLFINELFSGNHDAFNTHTDKLNLCQNEEQAKAYLENLSQEYNWQTESEAKQKLYQIIERKYI
jgi:hypothetical protein